jgi:hypothetical protein
VRAYANIADELEPAGYGAADITRIKRQLDHYLNVREIIRKASGESLDLKAYEADMRHLIDTYIEADEPRTISPFDDLTLLELIVKTGIAQAITSQLGGLRGNKDAIAETIENNVRRKIIKEHLTDPAYYEKMSTLLDEIIAARKAKAIAYEEYLRRIGELAMRTEAGHAEDIPEQLKRSPGLRALYNNLAAGGATPASAPGVPPRPRDRLRREGGGPGRLARCPRPRERHQARTVGHPWRRSRGGAGLPDRQSSERVLTCLGSCSMTSWWTWYSRTSRMFI